MDFKALLESDVDEVFFNTDEFALEVTLQEDDKEPKTFKAIFNIKDELMEHGEVVGHQPSILVTQEVEEMVKHRHILLIKGIAYKKSHTDDENVDLIKIFLERA